MKNIILKLINDMPDMTFFQLSKIVGLNVEKILEILGFDEVSFFHDVDKVFNFTIECLVIYENGKRLFFQNSEEKSEYFDYDENFKFKQMYKNISINEFLNYYDKRKYRCNEVFA